MYATRSSIAKCATCLGALSLVVLLGGCCELDSASAEFNDAYLGYDTPIAQGGRASKDDVRLPVWPENDYGLTYGSLEDTWNYCAEVATREELLAYLPDLITAVGIDNEGNRIDGYLLSTDYVATLSFTLGELVEKHDSGAATEMLLYSEDGTTVIGTFPSW